MACHQEFCNTFPLPAALLFLLWIDQPNSSADQTPDGHLLSPSGARGWSQQVLWKCSEECSLLWKEKGFRTRVSWIWRKERAEKEEVTQEGTTRQEQGRRKCLLVARHRNRRRASERKNVGNKDSNKATKKGCVACVKGNVQGWNWTLLEKLVQEPGLSMPCGVSRSFAVTRQCRGGVPSQTTLVWITAVTPPANSPGAAALPLGLRSALKPTWGQTCPFQSLTHCLCGNCIIQAHGKAAAATAVSADVS